MQPDDKELAEARELLAREVDKDLTACSEDIRAGKLHGMAGAALRAIVAALRTAKGHACCDSAGTFACRCNTYSPAPASASEARLLQEGDCRFIDGEWWVCNDAELPKFVHFDGSLQPVSSGEEQQGE